MVVRNLFAPGYILPIYFEFEIIPEARFNRRNMKIKKTKTKFISF